MEIEVVLASGGAAAFSSKVRAKKAK